MLSPDDFSPGMFIIPVEEGRDSGIPLVVLERDCNLLLFAVIKPGGERLGPHVGDLRYDSFRKISEEYVQAIVEFKQPNQINNNKQDIQPSDELFEQNSINREESYFDLILTKVGSNRIEVARFLNECMAIKFAKAIEIIFNFNGEEEGVFLSSVPSRLVTFFKNELEDLGAEIIVTHNKENLQ